MQVINYAAARPAREVLFTVIPPAEKYRAKLAIDTVVQRLGDTLGAGVFAMLGLVFCRFMLRHGCV